MKVTKQFIDVYNETFRFIRKVAGLECLITYFQKIGPIILEDLYESVNKEGLVGAAKYWRKTLLQEGCGFKLDLDVDAEEDKFGNKLVLSMDRCASKDHLVDPSKDYCKHCSIMYKDLFNKFGYDFQLLNRGPSSCEITIKKTKKE